MSRWPVVKLGEVCTIVGGGTPSRQVAEYYGGDIPWITPTDVTRSEGRYISAGSEYITDVGLRNSSARIIPKRSVLLTSRATIGFCAINLVPVSTNQGFANFICSPDVIPEFLSSWLEWSRARLVTLATGATFKEINKSTLKKIEIPLPPLEEQRRIVALLDRATEIRRRADAARAKARAIIPALFLDMFGDPATNPKGWSVAVLAELSDVQGGLQVTAKRSVLPLERPYLRVANVHRGALDLQEIKYIRLTDREFLRTKLLFGDVLVVEGHGNPNDVGRAAIWKEKIPECVHQNHLIRIRPEQSNLNCHYLESFLNSATGRNVLISSGKTTSGLNTISTTDVKAVRIPLPPFPLQTAFAEQAARIEAVAAALDRAALKADAMAAALSAEIFG